MTSNLGDESFSDDFLGLHLYYKHCPSWGVVMYLSSASLTGGEGPWAEVGEYRDFATNFCPCGGGNVGIFECPTYSRGECGDFASV